MVFLLHVSLCCFVNLFLQLHSKAKAWHRDMLTQITSLLLLKRQVLLFPFHTHLALSYETLFAPPTPNIPDVDWCSSADEKKKHFNLQRRPKECNLFFLSGLVFFHFSELNLCTQLNIRDVSGQVSGAWLGECVCVCEVRCRGQQVHPLLSCLCTGSVVRLLQSFCTLQSTPLPKHMFSCWCCIC